jgi:phosphoribosylanthranilate isomerase
MMRAEDAVEAAKCGADAIGLVFYKPAPRCLAIEQAREILDALPPFVTPVGLFVDAPVDEVCQITSRLNVRHVQLHGNESPQIVAQLRHLAVIKALRVEKDSFAQTLATWREAIAGEKLSNLKGFVLETPGVPHGGSGLPNDWATVRQHIEMKSFEGLPAIIAAGGLKPENVRNVIKEIRPWAVDVSSGVESQLGQKSPAKMAHFASEVRAADGCD